jgi:hypothetical protein
MRRIQLVLAIASMAILLAAVAVPAMAQGNGNNNGNDRHLDQRDVSLDRQLLNENDHNDFFGIDDHRDQVDGGGFFPFAETFFPGFSIVDQGCPFWGDTSGIVNQWDCVE